jgi:hypothetical protein
MLKPTQDEIAARAYQLYLERGCEDGHADEDWLMAEEELSQQQENESMPLKSRTVAAGQRSGTASVDG